MGCIGGSICQRQIDGWQHITERNLHGIQLVGCIEIATKCNLYLRQVVGERYGKKTPADLKEPAGEDVFNRT
jgi:hypothetical protein